MEHQRDGVDDGEDSIQNDDNERTFTTLCLGSVTGTFPKRSGTTLKSIHSISSKITKSKHLSLQILWYVHSQYLGNFQKNNQNWKFLMSVARKISISKARKYFFGQINCIKLVEMDS